MYLSSPYTISCFYSDHQTQLGKKILDDSKLLSLIKNNIQNFQFYDNLIMELPFS